ncbi:uncharacterized protein LOC116849950 [Odontomachus brunneus]|uniref:uncharacterized protein LOC116849950 n=1 Tax=Odontomachus brunneus TaxID=486640 RepID=UPI0013F1AB97|nr:uncharacterized protein LOC116849950 [Odontomachus brunneus]
MLDRESKTVGAGWRGQEVSDTSCSFKNRVHASVSVSATTEQPRCWVEKPGRGAPAAIHHIFSSAARSSTATFFTSRSHSQRDLVLRERRRDKKTHTMERGRNSRSRMSREDGKGPGVTARAGSSWRYKLSLTR